MNSTIMKMAREIVDSSPLSRYLNDIEYELAIIQMADIITHHHLDVEIGIN